MLFTPSAQNPVFRQRQVVSTIAPTRPLNQLARILSPPPSPTSRRTDLTLRTRQLALPRLPPIEGDYDVSGVLHISLSLPPIRDVLKDVLSPQSPVWPIPTQPVTPLPSPVGWSRPNSDSATGALGSCLPPSPLEGRTDHTPCRPFSDPGRSSRQHRSPQRWRPSSIYYGQAASASAPPCPTYAPADRVAKRPRRRSGSPLRKGRDGERGPETTRRIMRRNNKPYTFQQEAFFIYHRVDLGMTWEEVRET
ncbi:hypothetical protein VTK56DRAFT_5204 [Thermocarpiscus australiensis]